MLSVLRIWIFVSCCKQKFCPLVNSISSPDSSIKIALVLPGTGMFAVTVIVTLIGAVAQFGGALKDNPKGAIKSLLGLILLVILLVVAYNMGSTEPVVQGGGEVYSDAMWLKITDMFLYATYVMVAIAAIGTLFNMTGILKK